MTLSRQPLTIVEIDVDRCTRIYGSAPCTAVLGTTGAQKCFNTFATCQDVANFDKGTLTLRFSHNQAGLPRQTVFPALQSVSARPNRINLSGVDPASTALGQRARVDVTLQDFAYHDGLTDPYRDERRSGAAQSSGTGYDPAERGTFFAKLMARAPYYIGRSLRVKRGYVGDDLGAMDVAHYVISQWSGPDAAGRVSIVAKDVLDLADNRRAVYPPSSPGKLVADLTDSATSFTVTPAGAGASYAANGIVTIGRECMGFNRSGDTFTIYQRGFVGTEASSHSAGDVVQQAWRLQDVRASTAIRNLLTSAGVDASFIDAAAWDEEHDTWLGGATFSAIIPKPTGIATLIGELCQHGFMVWWDEIAQQVRFKANRPKGLDEAFFDIDDDAHIVKGSADVQRSDDQRISKLYFYHGMLDPTESVESGKNYARLLVTSDPSSASANEYNEERIKTIYSRWFGVTGNDAQVAIISERLVSRYRDTPIRFATALDVKDKAIELADLLRVSTDLLPDETGLRSQVAMQVNYVQRGNDRIGIEAESYAFDDRWGFIMLDSANDYDSATATEIAEGFYMIDDGIGNLGDGTPNYVMF